MLARVDPVAVRFFRLGDEGTTRVSEICLPDDDEEAYKYVREAVRAFPELYFAQYVILGEGDSEQVALPILAEARNLVVDRSFIAVVPLGGRHVNHFWRLLSQLQIPHATLLDLDWGREGGGVGRIAQVVNELAEIGIEVRPNPEDADDPSWDLTKVSEDDNLATWLTRLREYGVFFCDPLDLDWSLMTAYWDFYSVTPNGGRGPGPRDAAPAVLGKESDELEDDTYDDYEVELRWYRYLFLGRSKPSTHLRVLSRIGTRALTAGCPEELSALLDFVEEAIS